MKRLIVIQFMLMLQCALSQEAEVNGNTIWSLQDCIEHALHNNINIQQAALDTERAEVDYYATKSSRLPDLYGTVSPSLTNGNSIDPITSDYVTDQIFSTNVGITSAVTLYQGNQINNEIEQSALLKNKSEFLRKEVENNIVLNVVDSYLQALYAKEGITIAENNLISTEKEVERAKARLDAGTIALSDYTEAQSQAATNKYELIQAKNTYRLEIIELKQLLELDPTVELEIMPIDDNSDYSIGLLDVNAIYQSALNTFPEIAASELDIAIGEKELDIAEGGYLPTLSLIASVGTGYTSINDNSFVDQFDVNFNQRIGLSLSIPIFNKNQTKAAVQSANLDIEDAILEKKQVEKDIYLKVETAYQNALSAQEQLIAAEASMVAANKSYELAQKKYELGALSTTDLVISQNTYTNAQEDYLQAKYLNILYYQLLQFYNGNSITLK